MKVRIPSPAMIVAALALMFALGGTAVASGLDHGSPDPEQHRLEPRPDKHGVKSIDVQNNSLHDRRRANGTLRAVDFAPGVLPAAGPAGPAGAQGPAGPQGAPGLAGVEIVTADTASNSDNLKQTEVSCPAASRSSAAERTSQRRQRRGARRELPGERDEVAGHGLRGERHGGELAPPGLRDLRHRCGVERRHTSELTWARRKPRPRPFPGPRKE